MSVCPEAPAGSSDFQPPGIAPDHSVVLLLPPPLGPIDSLPSRLFGKEPRHILWVLIPISFSLGRGPWHARAR